MTDTTERAELLALAGRIEARIAEASKRYGHKRAAVRYDEAPTVVTALRRLAAQDQEPVGYRWRYFDHPWAYRPKRPPFADDEDIECEPLYLSPPPAAGWDDAIEARLMVIDECSDALGYRREYLRTLLSAHSHQPAPVAANASAEARLREEMTDWFGQIADLSTALRQGGPDPMDLQDLSDNLERACEIAGEALEALSAHPHASDCDKHGCMGDASPGDAKDLQELLNSPSVLDETTKSEGGTEGRARSTKADSVRGEAGSAPSQDGSLAQLAAGIESGPSDRTADVTWGELHAFILKHSDEWEDEGVAARALLDAYGMWRRR